MMPEAAKYYDTEESRIPDRIRVSFSDGKTAVYARVIEQPAPVVFQKVETGDRFIIGYAPGRMEKR